MTDHSTDSVPPDYSLPAESGSGADPRKYDEIIAVGVALAGIGSVLAWVWGHSSSTSSFPSLVTSPSGVASPLLPGTAELPSGQPSGSIANQVPGREGAAGTAIEGAGVTLPGISTQPQQFSTSPGTGAASAPAAAGAAASGSLLSGLLPGSLSGEGRETPQPSQAIAPEPTPTAASTPAAKPPAAVPSLTQSPPQSSIATSPSVTTPGKPKQFTDLPANSPVEPYIAALSSRGVVGGLPDGSFQPNKPVTRVEFAEMIRRAFEQPPTKSPLAFKDIGTDYWGKAAIEQATATGFMTGFPNQSFQPNQLIPKLQLQIALATGLGLKPKGDPVQTLSQFSDSQAVPKWAVPKLAAAVDAGIVPLNATRLQPNQPATRADAATMIYQALLHQGKVPPIRP